MLSSGGSDSVTIGKGHLPAVALAYSGTTAFSGGHTHTYSGNTENLGSGTALKVTNGYIMLMSWYRVS